MRSSHRKAPRASLRAVARKARKIVRESYKLARDWEAPPGGWRVFDVEGWQGAVVLAVAQLPGFPAGAFVEAVAGISFGGSPPGAREPRLVNSIVGLARVLAGHCWSGARNVRVQRARRRALGLSASRGTFSSDALLQRLQLLNPESYIALVRALGHHQGRRALAEVRAAHRDPQHAAQVAAMLAEQESTREAIRAARTEAA